MTYNEQTFVFECAGDRLIGIATRPERPIETGVIIIVGGPQYRAGSHRQFTLLARQLATQGIASFRFDYRGMGDSEGKMRNFEAIDADIRTAIDAFIVRSSGIKRVVLWGLCDAASAALYYGHTDLRVKSMVLLNPWVHTSAGAARARLKHYYLSRLLSKAFWTKLLSGKVRISASVNDLSTSVRSINPASTNAPDATTDPRHGSTGYIDRMLLGMKQFRGEFQFILSGQDLTAQEFISLTKSNKKWHEALSCCHSSMEILGEANHTFSSNNWRDQVGKWVIRHVMQGSKPGHTDTIAYEEHLRND